MVWCRKDQDTVYVLNTFLSHSFTYSDIKLYYTSPYYKEQNGETRTSFLNLSDTFFQNTYTDKRDWERKLILLDNDLKNDTIRLNSEQRNKFLEKVNVSESSKIFIYELEKDTVHTYRVQDLPLIACINIYFNGPGYEKSEYDYEFGFDLGKSYTGSHKNLAYIGEQSPFQIGKRKLIDWQEIENKRFPISSNNDNGTIHLSTFLYSLNNFDYFLQKPKEKAGSYHLVVFDKTQDTIVFDKHYYSSEGISLNPLNNHEIQSQYTGAIFKNKPPIIFGFTSHSFDCPVIEFIDKTELIIPILCDNRH